MIKSYVRYVPFSQSRRAAKVLAAVLVVCLRRSAAAQEWINPAGGVFENPANWAGDVFPDAPYFTLSTPAPYTVTINQSDTVQIMSAQGTSVVLNASSGRMLNIIDGLYVNASTGQTTSFTFNGSAPYGSDGSGFQVTGGSLGDFPGGVGGGGGATSFTVNNASVNIGSETYNISAGAIAVFSNSAVSAELGILGSVTFNHSNSSLGTVLSTYSVGATGTAATFNIMNGSSINLNGYSFLTVGGNTGYSLHPLNGIANVSASTIGGSYSLLVGASGGTGALTIDSGGQVTASEVLDGGPAPFAPFSGTGKTSVSDGSRAIATNVFQVGTNSLLNVSSGAQVAASAFNLSSSAILGVGLDAPDAIAVSGSALFAGTLDVTLGTAADPTLGNSYDLFTFGTESGSFSSINLPPLDPGLSWNTSQLYTTGTIGVVAAVPEPAMGFVALAACGLLTRRRRTVRRC